MTQVFPSGPAPKVTTSISSSAVSAHIHTCKLIPLLSPFPKPSREQVRQPGAQTSLTSTTPHSAPHLFYARWKESPSLCLARSIQQQRWAQVAAAKWGSLDPKTKQRRSQRCSLPLQEGSSPVRASDISFYAGPELWYPFGLLSVTGLQSSKRHPHPFVLKQPVSAVAVKLAFKKGMGNAGLRNTMTVPGMGTGMATRPHWLPTWQHCQVWQITASFLCCQP